MIVPGNTIKLVDIGTSNSVLPEVQSPVVKAVKNIKKKNAGAYIRLQPNTSETGKTSTEQESGNTTSGRGVVYLSHIPEGFFEDEMRQYFSQFGRVTRVKLARSRKTGRSRGYAFIEFQYAEVAKVVAETMNNYLLYNRLLKASYVDKQYPAAFWNQQSCGPQNCPLTRNRRIEVKRKNAVLNPAKELAQQGKRRRQLAKTLGRLRDAGVDYTLQVKDQVELPKGAEKRGKKFGGAKNIKQEKQTSAESVKVEVEEESINSQPVLLVDESDDEIEFNVPSFVIRKTLKRQSSSPALAQSPKVKKSKRFVKSEPLTPEVKSATWESLGSPGNQNGEETSASNRETRKSGRVSVIPKHISSSFQVTITPEKSKQKKSLGKENRESRSPMEESSKRLSTPKAADTAFPTSKKSGDSSANKKNINPELSGEKKIDQSVENTEASPKLRRQSMKTPKTSDAVIPGPVSDTKGSPKVDKNTGLTPKQMKNNSLTTTKIKTPKSAQIQNSEVKKTPLTSWPGKIVPKSNGKTPVPKVTPGKIVPKSNGKTPVPKVTPGKIVPKSNMKTPVPKATPNKPKSGNKVKIQKGILKTPTGRKSFPLSNQSNLIKKSGSDQKKHMGLKTPLKTPAGRKSQNWTAASSPKLKLSPLSHSTALKKRNTMSPKAPKPARKSLNLNK